MTTSPKFLSYPVLGGNINPKKILLVLGDPLQSVLPNGKFCGFTCVCLLLMTQHCITSTLQVNSIPPNSSLLFVFFFFYIITVGKLNYGGIENV